VVILLAAGIVAAFAIPPLRRAPAAEEDPVAEAVGEPAAIG